MSRRPTGVQFRTDIDSPVSVPPTPVVRDRAEELGVALDTVRGSGVAGRVRLADLAAAAGEPVPVSGQRRAGVRTDDRMVGDARAVVIVEADVTRRAGDGAGDGTELCGHVVSAALEAAAGGIAGAAVAVPDQHGGLRPVEVPNATELSAGGLARAMATVIDREPSSTSQPAPGAPMLTVVEAMEGASLDLPVVRPASAVTAAVGAPELRVVPTGPDDHGIAVRQVTRVAITWDPVILARSLIADVVAAIRSRLEGGA
ncbi:e3 binding domain-containing protein [Haloactinopolyspora alba]|uniref:E3 binding domain-containing protein n=1 Tax=Haloactinopolyspora alba TaxID=648780 RepID=A0A2P8EFI9_9ACTN|nr:E3 binding domain-containing protein [Haloactinopolyspora alba]PSL08220.1 e3 binding domain-containing protein [Haloactinopolyspora alba]